MKSIFAYYCIVSGALYLFFGFFCLLKNRASSVNRLWALSSAAIATWSIGLGALVLSNDITTAHAWLKVHYVGAILIPPTFYHYISSFLGQGTRRKKQIFIWHSIFTVFLLINLLTRDILVSISTSMPFFKFYTGLAPLYPVYTILFFICVATAFHYLISDFKQSESPAKKNQIKYMFLATFFGFAGGSFAFIPVFNLNVFPYGVFLVILYPGLMTYAIIKHNLLDIEVIVRRTAVFTVLFTFVYGIFTIFTILGQELFRNVFGWNQWASMIPTILAITFSLRPLEDFLTNVTEKFLFQKKYDYRQLLKTFADEIITILDLQKLLDQTVLQLSKLIKLDSACVLLHQKSEKCYTIVAAVGLKEKDVVFQDNDLLISMLREGHHPIQRDKASESVDGDGRLKDDFKKIKAQLCLPIMLHDELIGVLALGMKKSGEDFTPDDIDVLSTLARTEAIAISNAQLFDELSKTQAEAAQREKMAVIGTLAAGINHEICNPLGIVRGQCEMFLLNMRDGLYQDKTPEQMVQISSDIMAKVIKETDRATGITKKLSSFAKPSKKNDTEEVSIKHEVDEILGLLGHDLKLSNIEFRFNLPEGFPDILVDRKQFQEVLFNIIRNAAQAMDKKSGYIAIDGFTEANAVGIRIADNGMGIPKEKINQIFNPFFTTKAPGKGTGLGLFIVKQVVERNKGTIEVDSVDGEGTTFILRFPAALKLAAA